MVCTLQATRGAAVPAGLSSEAVPHRPLAIAALLLAGCSKGRQEPSPAPSATASATAVAAAPSAIASAEPAPPAAPTGEVTLLAGGDVSFGRVIGQILLKEPERDLFATIAPLLGSADLRFCNLEGPVSDQKGETESPDNVLIFTGPPAGADALARAGFDVVSTANNHAWDYGKKALFETMDNLDRVHVRYVGTGKDRDAAYRPVVLERNGLKIALLAVTDIWNQGVLSKHPGAEYVARADPDTLPRAVRALREDASIDVVAVSYHGGCEYVHEPITRTKEILRAAIDAGADIVIGHHPHVIQGVEWRGGKPILYSLGNFLMRMHSNHPWTGMSYLARIHLRRGAAPTVEACPFRVHGIEPLTFADRPNRELYERQFFDHLTLISKAVGGTDIGPTGDDGCAPLTPPARAPTVAARAPGR